MTALNASKSNDEGPFISNKSLFIYHVNFIFSLQRSCAYKLFTRSVILLLIHIFELSIHVFFAIETAYKQSQI